MKITKENFRQYVGRTVCVTGVSNLILLDYNHSNDLFLCTFTVDNYKVGHNAYGYGDDATTLRPLSEYRNKFQNKLWWVRNPVLTSVETGGIDGALIRDWMRRNPDEHDLSFNLKDGSYTKGGAFIHMHNGKKFLAFKLFMDGIELPIAILQKGFDDFIKGGATTAQDTYPEDKKSWMADHIEMDVTIKTGIQEPVLISSRKKRNLVFIN